MVPVQLISSVARATAMTGIAVVLLAASQLFGQFEITWYTIDGGGAMNTTGGSFDLAATVGQSDACSSSAMSGGSFTLTGGFWAFANDTCPLLSDMNSDGQKNGQDVQLFANCLIHGGACACADADLNGIVDIPDIAVFVQTLLN